MRWGIALLAGSLALLAQPAASQTAPTAADWAAIADLPDLSGTWSPDIPDQFAQEEANPPPWKPEIAEQVAHWLAEEADGRPKGLFIDCLPHGSPSLMAITHNAIEFLVTPGRVTVLGESDGNRIRRIWTDGRMMPEDPDPTFDGYSVGAWRDGALLADDMVITAPAILTGPWKTRRLFVRHRERSHEIEQGVCRQGDFLEAEDQWGNAIFEPAHVDGWGNLLPPPIE